MKVINKIFEKIVRPILRQSTKQDIVSIMWKDALHESIDYYRPVIGNIQLLRSKDKIRELSIQTLLSTKQQPDKIFLEFGVHNGSSINFFAKHYQKTIYGFDSFDGLPESWGGTI